MKIQIIRGLYFATDKLDVKKLKLVLMKKIYNVFIWIYNIYSGHYELL